ncbi:unnamed protein product [Orchesella dallaii]|uniref:Cytochrome P450 4C1 n=1 Tax=Orchesella dallaii TaxID=48710 RepID=A0ABP1Q796_9HEXA
MQIIMEFKSELEVEVDGVVQDLKRANIQNGLVAILAATLYLYFIVRRRAKSNKILDSKQTKRTIPGPGQHFLGALANVFALRDTSKTLEVMDYWCRKYGPVYRVNFGPYNVTVLNSPKYIQKLMGSKDTNYLRKGFIYKPFKPYWNDGLIMSKGEKWKSRRRVLEKHMFSFKSVFNYMKIFNAEADALVVGIGEIFGNGKENGIEHLLMRTSFQTITNAAFGESSAEVDSLTDQELSFIDVVNRTKEVATERIMKPWFLIDSIWNLHPMSKLGNLLEKVGKKYAHTTLLNNGSGKSTNKHGQGIKQDLLDAGVSLEGITEEVITLISAGYETTATSLHFLLFFLALNPHHQEICREEVDAVFEDIDLCPSGSIQFRALSKLKHLEMCVYETLRLLPTVFLIMRNIEAPLQLEDDLEIPAGSEIAIYAPGLHKNPKYFPDPDKFIPERFTPEQCKTRHPYAYIPFAAGPRKCIGYKFAMMEMLSLTAKLLRNYEWETTDRLEDVVLLPHVTITPGKPMKFLFKKRQSMNIF